MILLQVATAIAVLATFTICVEVAILNRRTRRMLEGKVTRKQMRVIAEAEVANAVRRAEQAERALVASRWWNDA